MSVGTTNEDHDASGLGTFVANILAKKGVPVFTCRNQ